MIQNYTKTPQLYAHGHDEDVLHILVCQIRVWKGNPANWFEVPEKCTLITEVEEIEINETYKELINEAVIRIPRGTVINETIISKKTDEDVSTGNMTNQNVESVLSESSRFGELLTEDTMTNISGDHTLMVDGFKSDSALGEDSPNKQRIATENDFQVGQRIQVRLAYIYQPMNGEDIVTEKIERVKSGEIIEELGRGLAFEGFIVGCSVSSVLEIECENMASVLKKVSCKKGTYKGQYTVNDFLKSGGKYDLLKNTGLSLAPCTAESNLKLSKFEASDNLSVADLISSWSNGGLRALLSRDGKTIKIGGFSVSEDQWTSDKSRIDYTDNQSIVYIQSDWDVVSDDIVVKRTDKNFLVINAKATDKNGKSLRVMVGKINDEFHYEKHGGQQKKQQKKRGGNRTVTRRRTKTTNADGSTTTVTTSSNGTRSVSTKSGNTTTTRTTTSSGRTTTTVTTNDGHGNSTSTRTTTGGNGSGGGDHNNPKKVATFDKDKYNIVEYYPEGVETMDELVKKAEEYWTSYNMDGISGSLVVFGDMLLEPAQVIGYISQWIPEKSGHYLIESVKTSFGVNGFRQTLNLPVKLSEFDRVIKTLE